LLSHITHCSKVKTREDDSNQRTKNGKRMIRTNNIIMAVGGYVNNDPRVIVDDLIRDHLL
jgi:hypothetical protein